MSREAIETGLLAHLDDQGSVEDSGDWAKAHNHDHLDLVGVLKSLEATEMVTFQDKNHTRLELTPEAESYVAAGASCELQVFQAVGTEGKPLQELKAELGAAGELGFRQAMQAKWVALDSSSGAPRVVRKVSETPPDRTLELLQALHAQQSVPEKEGAALRKRKLVAQVAWKTYRVSKGPKFARQRRRLATDLTFDMLQQGTWKDQDFKPYNFEALGIQPPAGALHPLLKVRSQFRKIFTQMGFEEMPTNSFVESSFWNFDALFQPQQHPARDAHDTFFITHPPAKPLTGVPRQYVETVKRTHERGGFGSTGYGSVWRESEAEKTLLRTHTTAVSSKMLYRLAQEGFRPAKYFSIDRVFRNEAVDRTHLAEFHQIEGVVCDRGLTLGHLIGVLAQFFERLGLKQLRFKPAYNPYTEPSMEIFSFSPQLGKWIEVGNSGMFRPEMLRPMGIPEDVNVIAWGLGLERPTMILYGIDNIRELSGHKVSLNIVKKNPICRLGL